MAETVLYNTVTGILKKLGSMVLQEIELVWGVKDELHKLENTVSTIRAVLLDAEEQQVTNHEVADWLEKLDDAIYDVDDLLDDFSIQVLRCQVLTRDKRLKKVRVFFSGSNQLAFSHKMAHEIKTIQERLDAIAQDRKKFHLTERFIEMRVENTKREETHSFVETESVIGRDGDKMTIIELLLHNHIQENVSVVALVGIGGLGKTTLAQLVYNNERVTNHFELKMWVCISDVFDVKLIVEKTIESATSQKPENLSMDKLQENLRNAIDGKKYLLVLDDVWNEDRERWLELSVLLMGGSRGSKILVTTRSEFVANVTGVNSPYLLKGLSEEESWSLFKKMAFNQREESENTFRVTIGKEIAQTYRGVPLAIRVLGSLLYSKDTDDQWLLFKSNDLAKIAEVKDVILPILKLSYHHLPSNLKICFAFCSLYLKDEYIDKQELIQLWIAHGFIQPMYENQQLEEVGDLYFMDLLKRSLLQDIQRNKWGDIISCKMHDLVHDLAESVVRPKSSVVNSNAENISERTRHLSLDFNVNSLWDMRTHRMRAIKLQTFISKSQCLEQTFKRIVSTYKYLRVLGLSDMDLETVPYYISKLKHLRYLDLCHNYIKTLPNSITELQNLQTLKLNSCRNLEELPRDIQKLVSLRHLELEECDALNGMPLGFGQLTSLLTLTTFVVSRNSSTLSELQSLINLRGILRIKIREEEEELLLESFHPPPNLMELNIKGCPRQTLFNGKGCKHLPPFGQLHSLQFLSVGWLDSLEYIDNSSSGGEESLASSLTSSSFSSSSSGGVAATTRSEPTPTFFPSLKELKLHQLPNLKGWWRSEAREEEATLVDQQQQQHQHQQQHLKKSLNHWLPSFPSLSILSITNCPNMASMPILQPCCEKLVLYKVSKKLVEQQLMMMSSPTISTTTTTVATSSSSSSSSILHLSKLKSLSLRYIKDLVTLPEWIGHLTSLELLVIDNCPKLTSLPQGMRQLTALQELTIASCANLLYDRCVEETGEDWPKIAHIPNISISR